MTRRVLAGLLVAAGLIVGIGPVAPASAAAVGEFTTPVAIEGTSAPLGIKKGSDGSVWFTERIADRLGGDRPGHVGVGLDCWGPSPSQG